PVSSPVRRPPWRPLFPYTTLFRSAAWKRDLASSRRFGGVETSAGVAGTAAVSVLLDLAAVLRGLAVLAPVSAIVSLSLAPIALRADPRWSRTERGLHRVVPPHRRPPAPSISGVSYHFTTPAGERQLHDRDHRYPRP